MELKGWNEWAKRAKWRCCFHELVEQERIYGDGHLRLFLLSARGFKRALESVPSEIHFAKNTEILEQKDNIYTNHEQSIELLAHYGTFLFPLCSRLNR